MAMATFIVGLIADLTFSPQLFILKNRMSLCSAPLEVLISILYWGISAIGNASYTKPILPFSPVINRAALDRELVVPPEIHLAPIADIGFHAAPSIVIYLNTVRLRVLFY
jgi:FAR-17a/AIG1-like protein